ncbi:MAG: HigA family addiction module antitoxin [Pseudomonadota bacterium]
MKAEKIPPVHPGEVLLEEFMKPMGISQNALARALRVPPRRINEIVHGNRGITVDTALRLARHFGTSVRFWIGLQDDYDLDVAEDSRLVERINEEVVPRATGMKQHENTVHPLTANH